MSTKITLAVLLAFAAATAADTPRTAQKRDAEGMVWNALRQSASDQFAGVLSFERQTWDSATSVDESPDEPRRTQQWSIATDNRDNLRGKIAWSGAEPVHFGQSAGKRWILMAGDLLIQYDGARPADIAQDSRLAILNNLLNNVDYYLERILDPMLPCRAGEVLMIDRDPAHPIAVIRIADETTMVSFSNNGDILFPQRIVRSDEEYTYQYEYSGLRLQNDCWVPEQIDFQQISAGRAKATLRTRISNIESVSAVDGESTEFASRLQIPKFGEAGIGPIAVVVTFTADGVTHDGGESLR